MSKIKHIIVRGIGFVLLIISKFMYRKKNRWIFGAWTGKQFLDNPKWLYLHVIKNYNNIEAIWITRDENIIKDITLLGGKAFKYNSIKAIYYCLTSKIIFFSHGYFDLCNFNIFGGAYKVQLWHGMPIKKINFYGRFFNRNGILNKIEYKLSKYVNEYNLYIGSSKKFIDYLSTEFEVKSKKFLEVGQPRNDILFNNMLDDNLKKDLMDRFKIKNKDFKIITYMPTFRDNGEHNFSFADLDEDIADRLKKILVENNAIIIEKSHFVESNLQKKSRTSMKGFVFNINDVDTQELLYNTDLLISDYSSCIFDYMLLDRPIILFVFDYLNYLKTRGLLYDLDEICCNKICNNIEQVLDYIGQALRQKKSENYMKINEVKKEFLEFEKGISCDKIIRNILS